MSETRPGRVPTAAERRDALRILEALLFASAVPLDERALANRIAFGLDVRALLGELQTFYALRGVNLIRVGEGWAFRTAADLAYLMAREAIEPKRLSRAAQETLAIIAFHQPVTRAEIEEIRGVAVARGTLDVLLETGWVRMRGRRRSPGRPVTYGTTPAFLDAFGLSALSDLPGLDDMKAAGLLAGTPPTGFSVPTPKEGPDPDEDPLDADDSGDE
ncbi:SMC-Scp complex subunit ScpB [Segnochrobactraceae bacterium EtOH-i3]